mgnify:CR=1 FL=1
MDRHLSAPHRLYEIRTVKVTGYVITYELYGNTILCDVGEDEELILHYVWCVTESQWPPVFREAMTQRLEALFLRGSGERYQEAEARDDAAKDAFSKARNRDSQSQTPRNPAGSPTLAAHGSGDPLISNGTRTAC